MTDADPKAAANALLAGGVALLPTPRDVFRKTGEYFACEPLGVRLRRTLRERIPLSRRKRYVLHALNDIIVVVISMFHS